MITPNEPERMLARLNESRGIGASCTVWTGGVGPLIAVELVTAGQAMRTWWDPDDFRRFLDDLNEAATHEPFLAPTTPKET